MSGGWNLPLDGGGPASGAGAARALSHLARGAGVLNLSVEAPARVHGWDVIILTAAGEHQARLYAMQIEQCRRRGLIGATTHTLVVDDPAGKRIGSGGATLNALRQLARACPGEDLARKRVLLIHAGGDSRRVPWAGILGKCFIPFPVMADLDRPVNTVFDHQLAIAAPIAAAMRGGGLLTFSGDALPLFDSAALKLPEHGGVVVTTPVSLDVAGKHGVIVSGPGGLVGDLLQKASPDDLVRAGALTHGGAALLDTGIYLFCGDALRGLAAVAAATADPIAELLKRGEECSLYEEIAAGLVPARHAWLRGRPLGARLLAALAGQVLTNHRTDDLLFIHFGTTAEVLDHLTRSWDGWMARRALAECGAGADVTAVVCASALGPETVVGMGSLVHTSRLGDGVRVGSRCVIVGADIPYGRLHLPDNTCLWQAPLRGLGDGLAATACCGVDDNPKDALGRATFANRDLAEWMAAHGATATDLWPDGGERTLWRARLFPAGGDRAFRLTTWMLGSGEDPQSRRDWLAAQRLGFADLHAAVDAEAFVSRQRAVTDDLVLRAARRTVESGLERNLDALGAQASSESAREELGRLGAGIADPAVKPSLYVPCSRLLEMKADLLRHGGRRTESDRLAERAFLAVRSEVSAAVRTFQPAAVAGLPAGACATVELPVRFDVAGGWSDTPPYCLERPARVLNMAMTLDGALPVGASVEILTAPRWRLETDAADGGILELADGEDVLGQGGLQDRFALLRTALVLCGFGCGTHISQGVRVRTWARVPRGSGLGTSSILAAALVTALQRVASRPADTATIIDMVLLLEQRLTTGGGWQDQIGGLVPGIKLISSAPTRPILPRVEPVPLLANVAAELEQRFVLAFTGIERLAKNVLQIVVARYLRRDGRILSAIADLVALAEEGRKKLALGDLDGLGSVMRSVWEIHQVLDPHCSSVEVDFLFGQVQDLSVGAKLAGAGGGGFLGVLAKDAEAAGRIRQRLAALGGNLRVYDWRLWYGAR